MEGLLLSKLTDIK